MGAGSRANCPRFPSHVPRVLGVGAGPKLRWPRRAETKWPGRRSGRHTPILLGQQRAVMHQILELHLRGLVFVAKVNIRQIRHFLLLALVVLLLVDGAGGAGA